MFDDDDINGLIKAVRLARFSTDDAREWDQLSVLEDKLRQRLKINYSADLWIDKNESVNLKLHFRHGDWKTAKGALIKFRDIIQERLNLERNCPYFEEDDNT